MSFKTGVVKLAAAVTLVVAGGVGVGWAQSASPIGTNTAAGQEMASLQKLGSMSMSFKVDDPTATVTFTDKKISGTTFLNYNFNDDVNVANANTGTVKVVTTSPNWDIEFYSKNGGKLRLNGAVTGNPLKSYDLGSSTAAEVTYGVQLGIYSGTTTTNPKMVTVVPSSDIVASTSTSPLAFSQILGIAANDTTTLASVLGNRAIYDDGTRIAVNTYGFATPPTAGITFVVNSGANIDGVTKVLRGNDAGTYADTLKLTFRATKY